MAADSIKRRAGRHSAMMHGKQVIKDNDVVSLPGKERMERIGKKRMERIGKINPYDAIWEYEMRGPRCLEYLKYISIYLKYPQPRRSLNLSLNVSPTNGPSWIHLVRSGLLSEIIKGNFRVRSTPKIKPIITSAQFDKPELTNRADWHHLYESYTIIWYLQAIICNGNSTCVSAKERSPFAWLAHRQD